LTSISGLEIVSGARPGDFAGSLVLLGRFADRAICASAHAILAQIGNIAKGLQRSKTTFPRFERFGPLAVACRLVHPVAAPPVMLGMSA
jgi:hypothetical protein